MPALDPNRRNSQQPRVLRMDHKRLIDAVLGRPTKPVRSRLRSETAEPSAADSSVLPPLRPRCGSSLLKPPCGGTPFPSTSQLLHIATPFSQNDSSQSKVGLSGIRSFVTESMKRQSRNQRFVNLHTAHVEQATKPTLGMGSSGMLCLAARKLRRLRQCNESDALHSQPSRIVFPSLNLKYSRHMDFMAAMRTAFGEKHPSELAALDASNYLSVFSGKSPSKLRKSSIESSAGSAVVYSTKNSTATLRTHMGSHAQLGGSTSPMRKTSMQARRLSLRRLTIGPRSEPLVVVQNTFSEERKWIAMRNAEFRIMDERRTGAVHVDVAVAFLRYWFALKAFLLRLRDLLGHSCDPTASDNLALCEKQLCAVQDCDNPAGNAPMPSDEEIISVRSRLGALLGAASYCKLRHPTIPDSVINEELNFIGNSAESISMSVSLKPTSPSPALLKDILFPSRHDSMSSNLEDLSLLCDKNCLSVAFEVFATLKGPYAKRAHLSHRSQYQQALKKQWLDEEDRKVVSLSHLSSTQINEKIERLTTQIALLREEYGPLIGISRVQALKAFRTSFPHNALVQRFEECDVDRDGFLNFREFCLFMGPGIRALNGADALDLQQ